jgi:hypothetical protein
MNSRRFSPSQAGFETVSFASCDERGSASRFGCFDVGLVAGGTNFPEHAIQAANELPNVHCVSASDCSSFNLPLRALPSVKHNMAARFLAIYPRNIK